MKIFLTVGMIIGLCGSFGAQAASVPGPGDFERQLAADPAGFAVPAAQDPAPVGQGSTAPGPAAEGDVNLTAIWQKPPEVVCKLTGPGSFNDNGTNSQVKGVDLGSMFEHKGRMYFVFGDTNIHAPTPSNHLSNVLAYTSDKSASDCISMHFITMRDVYKDTADFYAKESVIQAEEEAKESQDISPDISGDYGAHYEWASSVGTEAQEEALLKKTAAIYAYYAAKEDKSGLADYYARLSLRLINLGVSFSDDITLPSPRNGLDYNAHHKWALTAAMEDINSETKVRYDRLFESIDQNRVKQIFASKTYPAEYTDIPTYGVSINGRIYIYIMSIRSWSPWSCNAGSLAYSDDDGKTFTRVDNFFPENSNFIQVALVKKDGYLYLFGIPAGRYGGVKLGRVPEDKVLDRSAYRFYKASNGGATWVENEFEASIVVPGPVGELSVQWNPFRKAWLMTYLNERSRWIEARTAPAMEGPWSGAEFLSASNEVSSVGGWGYYGPFIHPTYTEKDGETLYYLLSLWSHYNVILMKTTLAGPYASSAPVKVPYALPAAD